MDCLWPFICRREWAWPSHGCLLHCCSADERVCMLSRILPIDCLATSDEQSSIKNISCLLLPPRCHLPMLYIGLEYGLTNNSKLAERFFSQALSIAPEDPFVIHEVAVVAFQNGEWVLHTCIYTQNSYIDRHITSVNGSINAITSVFIQAAFNRL